MLARSAILVPLLVTHLAAQSPSAWSVLPVPGGVQTAGIMQRGKVLAYRDGGTVYAFSGLTRSWRSTTVSANASLRIANALLVIRDGNRFTAFSSYGGRFASIAVGTTAALVNPAAHKNDSIAVVRDGTTIWAISGFVGQWTRLTVGASAQVAVQRHVAVVADGTTLHGMSAFRGRWLTITMASNATRLAADGTVGVASTASRIHGFSALRETWTDTAALPGTMQFRIEDDLAVWWDGVSHLGFSGLRGSFNRIVTGLNLTVSVGEQIAVAWLDKTVWFYSAPTGTWTKLTRTTSAAPTIQGSLALVAGADDVHAFSAPKGTVSALSLTPSSIAFSSTVAAVADATGKGSFFSATTGRWTPFPIGTAVSPTAITNTGALVQTATGFSAFCARTDTYHPVSASSGSRIHSDISSAVLAIEDGRQLHVFEPRRRAWISTALQGAGGLSVHFWRTSFVALDDTRALGFGAFHGRIESVALGSSIREVRSHSESGRAVTANSIAAFSASPLLSSPWQYPEFRRTFVGGADLDLHLSAASATGQAYLAMGAQPPFSLPGLGDVFLSSTLLLPVTFPLDARGGTARTTIQVPDVAGLRGTEVFMQALVLPTAGQPYVTDLASVLLY